MRALNTAAILLISTSMSLLWACTKSEEDDDDGDDRPDLASFVTYRWRADVLRDVENEEPLSVVITVDNEEGPKAFACCSGRQRNIVTCKLERFGSPRYYFGLHYHEFKLKSTTSQDDESLASLKVVSYGLLLPILKDNEERYAMIDSNWKALDGHGQLVAPHLYFSPDNC